MAIHPFRTAHALRQLKPEVAHQLRHAGIVNDASQRSAYALPGACTPHRMNGNQAIAFIDNQCLCCRDKATTTGCWRLLRACADCCRLTPLCMQGSPLLHLQCMWSAVSCRRLAQSPSSQAHIFSCLHTAAASTACTCAERQEPFDLLLAIRNSTGVCRGRA